MKVLERFVWLLVCVVLSLTCGGMLTHLRRNSQDTGPSPITLNIGPQAVSDFSVFLDAFNEQGAAALIVQKNQDSELVFNLVSASDGSSVLDNHSPKISIGRDKIFLNDQPLADDDFIDQIVLLRERSLKGDTEFTPILLAEKEVAGERGFQVIKQLCRVSIDTYLTQKSNQSYQLLE